MQRCVLLCTCSVSCSCGLISKLNKEMEDDCVIRFLRGLNDDYSQVRSQVMIMDPMPSIVRVFSMILQHEREFLPTPATSSSQDLVAFSFQSNDTSKPNSSNKYPLQIPNPRIRINLETLNSVKMQENQSHHQNLFLADWISCWLDWISCWL